MSRKIVLANGCFDIFHIGHLNHLEAAAQMGDMLVVSVTHDRFVKKGPGRPFFSAWQRSGVIRALRCVDQTILCTNSLEALKSVKPNIFVKGSEYEGKILPEDQAYCIEKGIEIRFTKEMTYSSTVILNALLNDRLHQG